MITHELVIDKEGYIRFNCYARPVDGVEPECWLDGRCNGYIWIAEDQYDLSENIYIPVTVAWPDEDNGPLLTPIKGKELSDE